MEYTLSKLPQGKIEAKGLLVINEVSYFIKFSFNYEKFHSWTKEEDLMESDNVVKIIELSQNDQEIQWEYTSFELKSKIVQEIFNVIKDEYTKECEFLNNHYTGHIRSDAYADHSVDYKIENYPQIVITFVDKQCETITLRKSAEKLRYVKKDIDGNIVRDSEGLACYLSDDEVLEKNLNLFETTIIAFNEKEISVAMACDEFGADGVWVNKNYQNRGIGLKVLIQFRTQFKESRKMGQMTDAGFSLARQYYRSNVLKI